MSAVRDYSMPIEAAKEVFWQKGFDETSVADLVIATGMNRYALYNAFGGKLEIFLEALEAYYMERRSVFLTNLEKPERPPIEAIRSVFEFAISEMAERGTGCLMCNVASGVESDGNIITKKISAYLAEIREAYCSALLRAEERGELNTAISAEQGADLFITLMVGVGAQAKNGADFDSLMNSVDAGLAAVRRVVTQ